MTKPIDRAIGKFLSAFVAQVAKRTTLENTADIAAETAYKLRQRFPLGILKAARFILDLAIDGEANATRKSPTAPPNQSRPID